MFPDYKNPAHCVIMKFWLATTALFLSLSANAYDAESYVVARPGSMPIILTVPHDGADFVPGVSNRSGGVTVRDERTRELAERTADLIEKKTGKRPYLIIAKFSRKQIDANRSEEEAVEGPEALPAYRAYHAHIATYIAAVKATSPAGGLLIDVHGQAGLPNTIALGTRNGLSVKSLLVQHGATALYGPQSILGSLQSQGFDVFPAAKGVKEDPRYNGGNTVFAYGSHTTKGIDAIQLEFGRGPRSSGKTAEAFANAILAFQTKYLEAAKQESSR